MKENRTPAAVVRDAFGAMSRHDFEAWEKFLATDAIEDYPAVGEYKGRGQIRAYYEELLGALPDFTLTVDRIVSDDSVAMVEWHAGGTFSGAPYLGLPPNGRRVDNRGVAVMEVDGGLIRHTTNYYDGAAIARQMGAPPGD